MAQKIEGHINLNVNAGEATAAPPIGSTLGQRKVNIMEFCKAFNAATQSIEKGTPLPTVITIYVDKSFTFIVKTPPASYLIKKYAKVKKGSGATKKEAVVGKITMDDCREIAKLKMPDLNTKDIKAATKIICGSAASMGIEVVGN
ncbi:50S ribosomal protein L11 [Rickettsia bellii]|uniref:Large ribosomal subunit protein uL11 n=4 Tax=Rickettsia bellii TaxID=33990 RepID=RL11_RICBR|nr:50S ribosomal protein L11 [Rickettsia bellii]A8GV20.1 RecName: Full=Large ribosomal subunit protein uL11; AltName: Full=50S ribosomal protein L11 [Rickettsia bellii OSU 85-389]Q1RHC6.1 RecName: Full=Large ribosomal subunit protein uL11; AltName: Full=50S ribosomal protein L11 [Rickettsia bellii RML369-C]ABE05238.1 50S ribosomal protein L11 [Rickettsia bellii RML369-C]ABV78691.1 50S ribosomal protein L11 [Rickettsia bellii OSU 85-389]ARD85803.1 50S ribosomal protein L11 [Rickettsia bellii]K